MARAPSLWDRIFSFLAWAFIAAIPVGIIKILWDQQVITAQMLEAGNEPLVVGWALVFLALLIFMWKNERIHRDLSRRDEKIDELTKALAASERAAADFNRHLELKEQVYKQKVEQLYADLDRQVQRRLLLAQQAAHQQQMQRNQLINLREKRLLELKENVPLLRELQGLGSQLAALRTQLVCDAGARCIVPDEVPQVLTGICARAAGRLLLVTRQVQAARLAVFDRGLADFWEKGGKLILWLDSSHAALRERVDLYELFAWYQQREPQVEMWGFVQPLPRLLLADRREALVLAGDLLGDDPENWSDFAAHIANERLAGELDGWADEQMLNRAGELGRLSLAAGAWGSYSDRHDHGLLVVHGLDRDVYVGLADYQLVNREFIAHTAGEGIFLLVRENAYGRYSYLAHTMTAAPAPVAGDPQPAAAPLPF